MNSICITGRIGTDLELQHVGSDNIAVLHFTVAVKRPNAKDKTDWIRCVAWRNSAEFIEKWFCKGKMIGITGIMTSNSWKDDSGKNHSINELLISTVEFCGEKKKDASDTSDTSNDIPPAFSTIDEEDVPF